MSQHKNQHILFSDPVKEVKGKPFQIAPPETGRIEMVGLRILSALLGHLHKFIVEFIRETRTRFSLVKAHHVPNVCLNEPVKTDVHRRLRAAMPLAN